MARPLSYAHGHMPRPFKYCTFPDMLYDRSREIPNVEAFIHYKVDQSRESITYEKLYEEATKVAEAIMSRGIHKGDRIGLLGPNSINRVLGDVGIVMMGGAVVPVSPTLRDTSDIRELLSVAKCPCLVIDQGEGDELGEIVDRLLKQITLKELGDCSEVLFLRQSEKYASYPTIDWKNSPPRSFTQLPVLYPEEPILVLSTSGSTGKPKLAEHTHFNPVNHVMNLNVGEKEIIKVYNDRPFGWGGGSPFFSMPNFHTRLFVDAALGLKKGYVETIWEIIKKENCGYAVLMPFIASDLVPIHKNLNDSFRLKAIIITGQIVSEDLLNSVSEISDYVMSGYGLTETLYVCITDPIKNGDKCPTGCVGRPLPGIEIMVTDHEGNALDRNQTGNIRIRSYRNFTKYLNNEEATSAAFSKFRWFNTGDMGYLSDDGQLIIKGRVGFRISRGTRKMHPEVIEHQVSQMLGIKNVIVVPVPDERLGEEVCVCYTSGDGHNIEPANVEEYCSEKFLEMRAPDGIGEKPKYYLLFKDLPKLSNGKPDRQMLKKEASRRVMGND